MGCIISSDWGLLITIMTVCFQNCPALDWDEWAVWLLTQQNYIYVYILYIHIYISPFPFLVYHCILFTFVREISVLWEMEIVNTHPSIENRMNRDKHEEEHIPFFIEFREKMIYFSFNQWLAKNILDLLFLLVSKHNS